MKDLNNDLLKYEGLWRATYDNKVYYLNITKQQNLYVNAIKIYQDVIKVNYTVKNAAETIVINSNNGINFTSTSDKHAIYCYGLQTNHAIDLYYGGTNCGIGWGRVRLAKINTDQMYWSYFPNSSTISDADCTPGQDLTIYLPITQNLVFTKQ